MKDSGTILLLKNTGHFSSLTLQELEFLGSKVSIDKVVKGKRIYREGDYIKKVYLVLNGLVKLESSLSNGSGLIKQLSFKNDFFGENIFSGEEKRCEDAEAVKTTTILSMNAEDFKKVVSQNHQMTEYMLKIFVGKMQDFEKRISAYKAENAKPRILNFFRDLAKKRAKFVEDKGWLLNHGLTHSDISLITDTSRQTVARVLNELKREGIINFETRRPHVMQVNVLM